MTLNLPLLLKQPSVLLVIFYKCCEPHSHIVVAQRVVEHSQRLACGIESAAVAYFGIVIDESLQS